MLAENTDNYAAFRDCFSMALLQKVTQHSSKEANRRVPRKRRNAKEPTGTSESSVNDADDLSDFIEV